MNYKATEQNSDSLIVKSRLLSQTPRASSSPCMSSSPFLHFNQGDTDSASTTCFHMFCGLQCMSWGPILAFSIE